MFLGKKDILIHKIRFEFLLRQRCNINRSETTMNGDPCFYIVLPIILKKAADFCFKPLLMLYLFKDG